MALPLHRVFGGVVSLLTAGSVGSVAFSAATNGAGSPAVPQHEGAAPSEDSPQTPAPEGNSGESLTGGAIATTGSSSADQEHASEDEQRSTDNGSKKLYTFQLKGPNPSSVTVLCEEGQKFDFGTDGSQKIYLGCQQDGNTDKFDSGRLLGSGNKVTCTLQSNTTTFECVVESTTKTYKFGQKYGDEYVYLDTL
ncbi:hypothetical protein MHLP_01240 [Candidatus Mycoplasma haematolamae str. Purdue]|uniref:Uncharacterized protein n=1 Tax=Mycoplasma haematolamae (strain Purdue) TaxID=1212765 RepID=I7BJ18_MYCHA|nr:hypothetical protein [Candidatus Mycoplasma haematolamae]AFO51828.1 hypothetical protein MHLP_01240 [Candidatus Mycoplasma haematolamae str. Purdue]